MKVEVVVLVANKPTVSVDVKQHFSNNNNLQSVIAMRPFHMVHNYANKKHP